MNKSRTDFKSPPYRVYIAAPFFNPAQVAWCEDLEKRLTDVKWEFFSPRLQHDGKPDMTNPRYAAHTFVQNVRAIDWCNVMIANVDWLLPEGQEVRLLDSQQPMGGELLFKSGPLNLPDAGTMWELGLAFPRKIYGSMAVILVTKACNREDWKPNLMLANCANAVTATPAAAMELLQKYGEQQFGSFYRHQGDVE